MIDYVDSNILHLNTRNEHEHPLKYSANSVDFNIQETQVKSLGEGNDT